MAGFNPKYRLALSWGMVFFSILFAASLLPITTIECSENTNTCSVYKKQTSYSKKEEILVFSTDKIKSHAYRKFLVGKNSTSYNPVFIMEDKEEVEIPLMASYKTAKNVINGINNNKNYKASFWLGKYSLGILTF